MLLLNRPIWALLLKIDREPINVNNDDEYFETLKPRQETYTKNNYTHMDSTSFSAGSIGAVQMEDWGPWKWSDHERQQQRPSSAILLSVGDKDGQSGHVKHEAH